MSVAVSKVNRAAAPKGTQSCTIHGFYVTLIFFLENFSGVGLRGEKGWGLGELELEGGGKGGVGRGRGEGVG